MLPKLMKESCAGLLIEEEISNINKILNKKSKIINSFIINKNMHLFTDNGEIIILDQNLEIQETVNLKIKNINKVYNYQNKFFISTEKGITHIY